MDACHLRYTTCIAITKFWKLQRNIARSWIYVNRLPPTDKQCVYRTDTNLQRVCMFLARVAISPSACVSAHVYKNCDCTKHFINEQNMIPCYLIFNNTLASLSGIQQYPGVHAGLSMPSPLDLMYWQKPFVHVVSKLLRVVVSVYRRHCTAIHTMLLHWAHLNDAVKEVL